MHLTVFTQFSTDSWVWAPKEDLARLELNSKFVIQMVTNWNTNVCRLCFKKKCLCCMWSKWFVQRQEKSCLKEYSHLIQLFIDLLIILIVFTKLGDQGPISQCEQLRVLKNKQTKNQQKPHRSHVMFATHKSGQMTTFLPARKAYIKIFKLNNNLGMGYFWTSRS